MSLNDQTDEEDFILIDSNRDNNQKRMANTTIVNDHCINVSTVTSTQMVVENQPVGAVVPISSDKLEQQTDNDECKILEETNDNKNKPVSETDDENKPLLEADNEDIKDNNNFNKLCLIFVGIISTVIIISVGCLYFF